MSSNAGGAFVDLVPRVSKGFEQEAASKLEGPLKGIGSKVGGLLAGAFAAAGAIGVGAFVKSSAKEFSEVGGEIIKIQRLTGLGAEAASKLRFAAKESGVDVGQLGTAIGILSKHLAAGDKAADAIGVSFKNARGEARPLNDVLGDVAQKFARMPDGVEKNALAMQLFGRSGKDLIPFLNKGRDGLAELGAEAQKFGLVLTQDNLDAIKKNVAGQRELHAALSGLRVQLGQYVLPLLTKGTVLFTRLALRGIDIARRSIDSFKKGFVNGLKGLGGFQGFLTDLGVQVRFLYERVKEFFSGLLHGTDALGSMQGRFAAFGAAVRAVFSGIIDLLHGNVQGFAGELAAAFGFDSSSPLFRGLERFANAVKGFVEGIGKLIHGDIAGWAVDVATGLGFTEDSRFTNGLINLGNAVKAAFEWLFDHIDLLKRVGELIGGLLVANKVAGGLNDMGRAIGGIGDLASKLSPANTELGKLLGSLGQAAGKTFSVSVDVAQTIGGGIADIGKSIGAAVSKALAQSLKDQATSAGISAALQAAADKLATGLAAAFGAAFGPAALEAIGTFIFGTLLPALGAALAAIAASPVLLAVAIAVGVAAAGALIYAFRTPIANFFTKTLPDFFVNTALPAVGRFFTETLPRFIGEAIATMVASLLVIFLVLPIRLIQLLVDVVPQIVGAAVGLAVAVGTAIGNAILGVVDLVGSVLTSVVGFFVALPGQVAAALAAFPGIIASVVDAVVGFILRLPAELPGYVAAAVTGMISFLSQLPGAVINFVGSLPGLVGGFLSNIIETISRWPVVSTIIGILGQVLEGFRDGWRRVNELTGGALNELVGFFASIPGRIGSSLSNVFSGLWEGFRFYVNQIIRGWNRLRFDLPSIDLGPLGQIGGGTIGVPQIPYLWRGGDVMREGMAVVGDRGPELVRLPKGASVEPLSASAATDAGIHIENLNVNNPVPEKASESVPRELARLEFLLTR